MQAAAAAASAAEAGGAASGAGGGSDGARSDDRPQYFGAAARDASSQRYSLSQAGREGRPGTPPHAVEETRRAGDKVTRRGAEEKEISLHR